MMVISESDGLGLSSSCCKKSHAKNKSERTRCWTRALLWLQAGQSVFSPLSVLFRSSKNGGNGLLFLKLFVVKGNLLSAYSLNRTPPASACDRISGGVAVWRCSGWIRPLRAFEQVTHIIASLGRKARMKFGKPRWAATASLQFGLLCTVEHGTSRWISRHFVDTRDSTLSSQHKGEKRRPSGFDSLNIPPPT